MNLNEEQVLNNNTIRHVWKLSSTYVLKLNISFIENLSFPLSKEHHSEFLKHSYKTTCINMSQFLWNQFSKNRQNYKLPKFYVKKVYLYYYWTVTDKIVVLTEYWHDSYILRALCSLFNVNHIMNVSFSLKVWCFIGMVAFPPTRISEDKDYLPAQLVTIIKPCESRCTIIDA